MWIHDVKLEKYRAIAAEGEPLRLGTSDSQGNEQLRINCGEGWEDLAVRVIFRPCKVEKVVFDDGIVDVPWEATQSPLTAAKGKIVFRGLSEDGRVINTLDLPYCVEGHSPVIGREENEYTPGIVDQYVNQVREDSQAAQQAAKDAAASQSAAAQNAAAAASSAAAASTSAQAAKETADRIEAQTKQYADAAAASAQAAKETADGIEERTKQYADAAASSAASAGASAAKAEAAAEEVAQIAKDGPVVSVNGKTGRVQLEAADLPFDNAGTPFLSTTVQNAIEELLLIGGGGSAVSVIRVTAPAGAVVTVQKGTKVYTQTVDSYGTELSFMVLETGSWNVSASWNGLQDARTINVAEAGGSYSVVLDFAPFRAYIHVTAQPGAVVTASKGDLVVSDTVTGSDVTLTVQDKGQWMLSATYDGGNAVPVMVDVQDEEATYEAELHFLVITVTAPAGAEVTAAKDGDTIQKTAAAGTADLYLTGPGLWTVSAVYDGAGSQPLTVEVNAGQYTYTAESAFATLEVTAPAGSVIQARNEQTELTKTADAGSALFYLPALGTWDLTATLNGQTATGSVDCSAYQRYTAELSYFAVTIKVAAVQGALVTASMDGYSVSEEAGSDGFATLIVTKPGSYTVSAIYSDASSNSKPVQVSQSGEEYTISVEFITLTVITLAGSTIQARNGQTVLTKRAETGSALFYLPALGTWNLTATLGDRQTSGSLDCSEYRNYSTELAYFEASIKATAVQGAVITAALDSYSVSGEAGSDGTVTLTVINPGSYTVSATYSGASSNSKAVQVSQSGQQYIVSVEFITLTVTAPAGSTITAKNGATTLTDTGGTVKFWLPNTGSWTVTAELDDQTASSEVQCSEYRDYAVELVYVHIYGVSWDGTSTTRWTRTDQAADFVDPVPYVQGAESYGSPFDDLYPWSGMVRVSDPDAGELVAIPKFWFKWSKPGTGLALQIADKPVEGFHVSPAHMDRGDGKGERDVVYIGRYHSTGNGKSVSGESPVSSTRLEYACNTAHELGDSFYLVDIQMVTTIWMLYLVEFADWNSQEKIGYGCGADNYYKGTEEMGYTDDMPYHTGTTESSRETYGFSTQYRNIEGLWENVNDFIAGYFFVSNKIYVSVAPNSYSHGTAQALVDQAPAGIPTEFEISKESGFEWFIYPVATIDNSNYDEYVTDLWGFSVDWPMYTAFGGSYDSLGKFCGLFRIAKLGYTTEYSSEFGYRIEKLP